MTPEKRETLRSSTEMVISLSESPHGKPCIGMKFAGTEWILLTTKTTILADKIRQELKEHYNLESIAGPAFDWRTSIDSGELVVLLHYDKLNKPVSIFVPAENFDDLANNMSYL